jgi:hypothetical protein
MKGSELRVKAFQRESPAQSCASRRVLGVLVLAIERGDHFHRIGRVSAN